MYSWDEMCHCHHRRRDRDEEWLARGLRPRHLRECLVAEELALDRRSHQRVDLRLPAGDRHERLGLADLADRVRAEPRHHARGALARLRASCPVGISVHIDTLNRLLGILVHLVN